MCDCGLSCLLAHEFHLQLAWFYYLGDTGAEEISEEAFVNGQVAHVLLVPSDLGVMLGHLDAEAFLLCWCAG